MSTTGVCRTEIASGFLAGRCCGYGKREECHCVNGGCRRCNDGKAGDHCSGCGQPFTEPS